MKYCSVDDHCPDVFLYRCLLGVTEIPRGGAHVGELFANIIGDGFARLRNGDRFFFENTEAGLTPRKS